MRKRLGTFGRYLWRIIVTLAAAWLMIVLCPTADHWFQIVMVVLFLFIPLMAAIWATVFPGPPSDKNCTECGSKNVVLCGEDDYGPCDYDSAGRSVDSFTVRVYKCNDCGRVFAETHGDVMGDGSDISKMIKASIEKYS